MSGSYENSLLPGYLISLSWSLDSVGGVSQVVENLMCQMECDTIYNPILLVNSWDDVNIRKKKINNYDHFFLRIRKIYDNKKPIKNFLAYSIFIFPELYRLNKFLKEHNITVVNVHYCGLSALNFSLLKVLRFFNGKLLLSFHGTNLFTPSNNSSIAKLLWKLLLSTSDNVVTCSDALKKEVAKIDRKSEKKIITIHNGIEISLLEKDRDRNYNRDQRLDNRKFLLNVGAFDHIKGQDILLKAFAKIESLFPEIDLVMIGSSGATVHKLGNLAKELNLEQRVTFYEGVPHNQMAAFYENATIFVLPSRYETFGIVILEAGLFGLPVVASNVGGIPEIVTHNKTAKLCEPENSDCLSREIKNLLESSDERERLGKNLKEHVMNNFSWNRTYRQYIKCVHG